ncbi:terminase small subunit [Mucilaginibacter robiniae]|uniref:hypothetical protein n=1 Tax=Mucilaginibacter robiniae TaxID=2728022 RepID=UPI001B7D17AC
MCAGYSKPTGRHIGAENLSKPYIRVYIKSLLEEKAMKWEEAVKLVGGVGKSS